MECGVSFYTPKHVIDFITEEIKGVEDFDAVKRRAHEEIDPDCFDAVGSWNAAWNNMEQIAASRYVEGCPVGSAIDLRWCEFERRAAKRALDRAYGGDFSPLLVRLRTPNLRLTQMERDFIAGRLDGTIKMKRGRKKSNAPSIYLFARLWLVIIERDRLDVANLRIETAFAVSPSHVHHMLRRVRGTEAERGIRRIIFQCFKSHFLREEVRHSLPAKIRKLISHG